MTVLVVVAVVLALVLWDVLPRYAGAIGSEAVVSGRTLDAFEFSYSETAAGHLGNRPFAHSTLLIQEIMDAAEPVADPQGAVNTVRWEVPGTFNGCAGTWELVVNTAERIIYHFDVVR